MDDLYNKGKKYFEVKHNILDVDHYVFPKRRPFVPQEPQPWPPLIKKIVDKSITLCSKYNIDLVHGHIDEFNKYTYLLILSESVGNIKFFYNDLFPTQGEQEKITFLKIKRNYFLDEKIIAKALEVLDG